MNWFDRFFTRKGFAVSLAVNLILLSLASAFVVKRIQGRLIQSSLFSRVWLPDFDHDVPAPPARCPGSKRPSEQGEILLVGDSLTAYGDWKRLLPDVPVANAGIVAEVTDCVLYRLASVLRQPPKKLFLMIGINDLVAGKSPVLVAANYQRIVSSIRFSSPDTQLYLQALLPVQEAKPHGAVKNSSVRELNEWIRKIAETHQAKYVDLFPRFVGRDGELEEGLGTDGLHLSAAGYERWKTALLEHLRAP